MDRAAENMREFGKQSEPRTVPVAAGKKNISWEWGRFTKKKKKSEKKQMNGLIMIGIK